MRKFPEVDVSQKSAAELYEKPGLLEQKIGCLNDKRAYCAGDDDGVMDGTRWIWKEIDAGQGCSSPDKCPEPHYVDDAFTFKNSCAP
jgi:hypothetical protein